MIQAVYSFFVAMLGLCIGSFLNAALYRLEKKRSMTGRSACPRCSHPLAWYDLFPVASFLFLGGRCRYCKQPISPQYPLVEITTGVLFLAIFNFQSSIFNVVFYWYVVAVLIFLFVYDLKHYLIPDKMLLPAIGVAVVFRLVNWALGFEHSSAMLSYALGAMTLAGLFFLLFIISRGTWIGFGDVKLALLMGLMLGWLAWVALMIASIIGSAVGIGLMVFAKKGLKTQLPFAPFLISGTLIVLFWGSAIINWYINV